jgi:hypothetical protein
MTGRLIPFILALGLMVAAPHRALADASASQWTPAFRIGPGLHVQGLDGSVFGPDTPIFIHTPSPTPDNPATTADEGFDVSTLGAPGDSIQTVEFSFRLRLYAPQDLFEFTEKSRIRPFIQMGAERPLDDGFVAMRYNSTFDTSVASRYGAGRTLSEFCPGTPATQACAYESRVRVDVLATWSAGFGADFTLPIAEDQYHLVPFVEYFGQAYQSESEFELTLRQSLSSDNTKTIKSKTGTEILHGVAAGLGFEVDVYEAKWFAIRLFLESRAAWLLNDREARTSATNPTPTPGFNTADFMVRPSGFVVKAGGGLEIRLIGH